jgi:hypothetical protein
MRTGRLLLEVCVDTGEVSYDLGSEPKSARTFPSFQLPTHGRCQSFLLLAILHLSSYHVLCFALRQLLTSQQFHITVVINSDASSQTSSIEA